MYPVNEPFLYGPPVGTLWTEIPCFQSLFYIPPGVSSKQGLLLKLNLTFLSVSPEKEPSLHGPPKGTLWTEIPCSQS